MSFNHLTYDSCTYARNLKENVSILGYILSPFRYEHNSKCRHELGLIGGTSVSHVKGNLVDLESDLRGQTRYITQCTSKQWQPLKPGQQIINDKTPPIDTTRLHLKGCQMLSYREIPIPKGVNYDRCPK
jgi:hypothetical protein